MPIQEPPVVAPIENPRIDYKQVYSSRDPMNAAMFPETRAAVNAGQQTQMDSVILPPVSNEPQVTGLLNRIGSMPSGKYSDNTVTSADFSNKISPAGAILSSVGPASQLIGSLVNGADKTRFDRASANLINLDRTKNMVRENIASAKAGTRNAIKQNSRTPGQLLSNIIGSNNLLAKTGNQQLAAIGEQEANTNAQIQNQTNQFNTNIAMQEQIANEQNRAAYRGMVYGSLTDLGNAGAGYIRDNAMLKAENLQNQRGLSMLNSLPYVYEWVLDENGVPSIQRRK
jgi:hypothetical protein